MLHTDWIREFKDAFAKDHDEDLELLLEKTKIASCNHVNEWHTRQLLGVLADRKKNRNDFDGNLSNNRELASSLIDSKKEVEIALGTACALLATDLLHSESTQDEAFRYAKLAFECLGNTLDPSPLFVELINSIRQNKMNS